MDGRHAGARNSADTGGRGRREFGGVAGVVGPLAGLYLARQDVAEARRAAVARRWALRETRGAARPVLARLRQSLGAGLGRAGERLRSCRRVAPTATTAAPIGPAGKGTAR